MPAAQQILRLAANAVPRTQRHDWLAEWQAELHYIETTRPADGLRFSLGAIADAFWLRCATLDGGSPVFCLFILSLLAGAAVAAAPELPRNLPLSAILLEMGIAVLIVPAVTPFVPGDYPRAHRLRRWAFIAGKVTLLVPFIFFGTQSLGALIAVQLQAHGLLIGCVLGLRWAILDQQCRCPVCLRRLTGAHPAGNVGSLFLNWAGTKLICPTGHGLLHLPALPTSSYSRKIWGQYTQSPTPVTALKTSPTGS